MTILGDLIIEVVGGFFFSMENLYSINREEYREALGVTKFMCSC
jgi:hypothetical protein